MSSFRRVLLACVVSLPLAGGPAFGAAPTAQEIARAVEQLGSDNFRARQKASNFLWAAGKAAEPALKKALKSGDREVVRRAREILEKFKYGIYPDTPKNVLELIGRYRSGNDEARLAVMRELKKLGSPGQVVLIKLAGVETDDNLRRQLFRLLTGEVVPDLLVAGRYDEVEELLELGLKGGDNQAVRNYAAYLALRGRLDARLPEWAARARKLTGYKDAEVLAYLYRAKGDLAGALKAARRTDNKALVASLRVEQGDWKDLAADPEPPTGNPDPVELLGYSVAYHRLAGNAKEFDKAVANLLDYVAKNPDSARRVAIALLLNNRPKQAIDLLVKSHHAALAFELLATQNRYAEAFRLADNLPATHDADDVFALRLEQAKTVSLLGDKDQAAKILAKEAAGRNDPKDCSKVLQVVETAYQTGLKDQAFTHAAAVIAQAEKEGMLETLFGHLFPETKTQAPVWWKFFRRKDAAAPAGDSLKRVREVLEKKLAAKDFAALAKEVETAAGGLAGDEGEKWFQALGETCLLYGRQGFAQGYLEKAGSASALTRLGDLLADQKLWQQAAQRYGQAWDKDRTRPVPLYLKGWALEQAGLKAEGRKLIDLAHLIPLADDAARFKLSTTLAKHGALEAADRERQFITRTGRLNYAEISNSLRYLGLMAYSRKEYQRAAECFERTLLVCLGNVYFIRSSAYLTVPANVHFMRAQGLLAAGKLAEALQEEQLCLASVPGDIESAINLVPELDRRGRKKEANELYQKVFDHYEKVCKAYPRSAQHHNSLAWLMVCCRRNLDQALAYSNKAVELAPHSAGYLDTLAEIYYQRGDKVKAVQLMKKCIEMDPKSSYYKKQVKRFQAEGPPSETPRTN